MKKEAFEYVLFKLIEWYNLNNHSLNYLEFNSTNDLSKLKILKLHFFVTTVNAKNNNLLDVFNNFYAMPYGHVESDIYNELSRLERYVVSNRNVIIKDLYLENLNLSFELLESKIKLDIDSAVETLKLKNSELINLSALDLVEISHHYFSWKYTFNHARVSKRFSEPIPVDLIKDEIKYFALN